MKTDTIIYKGVTEGDHCKCSNCGAIMLLPYGADRCPECESEGMLAWVDETEQETNTDRLSENGHNVIYSDKELKMTDYLSEETIEIEINNFKQLDQL